MNDGGPLSPPGAQQPLHVLLYRCGAAILVLGLASSVLIYLFARDSSDDPTRQVTRTKAYQHTVELMGGKGALYAARFNDWFADLWRGQQLAYTVAVIAVVVAAVCFLVGLLISEPLPDEADAGHGDRE